MTRKGRTPTPVVALALSVAIAVMLAVLAPGLARAIDRNFAGSAQLDYHFVPTQPGANLNQGSGNKYGFDGFTIEASEKVAIDVSDRLSVNVKVCFGCHGFELDMTYLDYRIGDEMNLRVGRFSPSFGSFNLRHDVANHKLSDKPLVYDMGRMLRLGTWNEGVLPSPFPDNGVEVNGSHWFGETTQLDYAVYAIGGFKAGANPVDIDFTQSRAPYYTDNNGRPTVGARTALTTKLGPLSDVTLGASGMYGTYDPNNELTYAIVGADLVFRFNRTNVRFEYLARRTEMDVSNRARFALVVPPTGGDFVVKHGGYAEVEQPLSKNLDAIARIDGLFRVGNYLQDQATDTPLKRKSSVLRYTLGTTFAVERGLRFKLSTELWQFSDADEDGRTLDVGMHVAAVGTF